MLAMALPVQQRHRQVAFSGHFWLGAVGGSSRPVPLPSVKTAGGLFFNVGISTPPRLDLLFLKAANHGCYWQQLKLCLRQVDGDF